MQKCISFVMKLIYNNIHIDIHFFNLFILLDVSFSFLSYVVSKNNTVTNILV